MTKVEMLSETSVRVSAAEPDGYDVLEYALALIETEGWRKKTDHVESSREAGWTLHDAVGEANRRLFPTGNDKDGVRTSGGETTRQLATAVLTDAIVSRYPVPDDTRGPGDADKWVNDQAADAQEITSLLAAALEGRSA